MKVNIVGKNITVTQGISEKINKKFIKQSKNKKKEEFYADKDISFEAKDNEVLGILGPNGAGKTTLLRMVAGIMTPSGGSITIDNLNYHDNEIEIKKRIAFLTGNTKLYKDLSAYELLTMCGNCLLYTSDAADE